MSDSRKVLTEMLKPSHIVFSVLGALSLTLGSSAAEARRVPGWAGIPDPPSSGVCWSISASRLSQASWKDANGQEQCLNSLAHYFQLPLVTDTASGGSQNVSWQQGYSGLSFGTVCGRVATINNDGTVASAPNFQCGAGTKTQSIAVPTTGSAMLTVYMQSSGALSNTYLSNLTYAP